MSRYQVVLVPFPFDELSAAKVRPAVCLTDPVGEHHHVVLAFITSHVPPTPLPTALVIDARDRDVARTGLRVSSTLQLHRMMTVTDSLLLRELGVLSPRMEGEVQDRLRPLFGLA